MNKSIFSSNELNPIKLRSFLRHLRLQRRKSWEIESEKPILAETEEPKTDFSKMSKAEARKLYKRIQSLKRTVKRVKGGGIKVVKPPAIKKTGVKKPVTKKRLFSKRKAVKKVGVKKVPIKRKVSKGKRVARIK